MFPAVHHDDWRKTGKIAVLMFLDPMIADLPGQRVVERDRPTDAAHLADCKEILSPGLKVAVALAQDFVELTRGELRRVLGEVIKVVLMQPHAVEFPAHAAYELGVFCI